MRRHPILSAMAMFFLAVISAHAQPIRMTVRGPDNFKHDVGRCASGSAITQNEAVGDRRSTVVGITGWREAR